MNEKNINIEKLSLLAKLQLSEDEKASLENDLKRIVTLADDLLSVENQLLFHEEDEGIELREDTEGKSLSRDSALKNAPDTFEGFIAVPKFLN
ncbi:MAG: Asp-tRNA(Asn)/Glu-tRNA(Gln) amidotransferase subunit GatC [Ruminococcaceae bacterium]|nr:Asp-tRNA(Asn)/Glu-tRNA(Gln) amidotransferase subunit GatC [Oscillospiraceae bacterium]